MKDVKYELQDMIISALRYSVGRKTYITEETCTYIREHPELIDKRVKDVMLNDLKDIDEYYKNTDIDYVTFKDLEQWLEKLEVEE